MLDLKANFRGKYGDEECELCSEEEDSTEHLFKCTKLKKLLEHDLTIASLMEPKKKLAIFLEQAMVIKCRMRWISVGCKSINKITPKGQGRE